jgi:hypothetical protein
MRGKLEMKKTLKGMISTTSPIIWSAWKSTVRTPGSRNRIGAYDSVYAAHVLLSMMITAENETTSKQFSMENQVVGKQ